MTAVLMSVVQRRVRADCICVIVVFYVRLMRVVFRFVIRGFVLSHLQIDNCCFVALSSCIRMFCFRAYACFVLMHKHICFVFEHIYFWHLELRKSWSLWTVIWCSYWWVKSWIVSAPDTTQCCCDIRIKSLWSLYQLIHFLTAELAGKDRISDRQRTLFLKQCSNIYPTTLTVILSQGWRKVCSTTYCWW